jgi:hypothetical protein
MSPGRISVSAMGKKVLGIAFGAARHVVDPAHACPLELRSHGFAEIDVRFVAVSSYDHRWIACARNLLGDVCSDFEAARANARADCCELCRSCLQCFANDALRNSSPSGVNGGDRSRRRICKKHWNTIGNANADGIARALCDERIGFFFRRSIYDEHTISVDLLHFEEVRDIETQCERDGFARNIACAKINSTRGEAMTKSRRAKQRALEEKRHHANFCTV